MRKFWVGIIAVALLACCAAPAGAATQSAAARHPRTRPVMFSYGSSPLQVVSAYTATSPNSPVVILIHGGGFVSTPHLASELGPEATNLVNGGAAVFIVNYRSDTQLPAADPPIADQVADIVAGTHAVASKAAQFDGNSADVTLIGGSSGGTLAADAGLALGPSVVDNVVTLSGVFDLTTALAYWRSQTGPLADLHVKHESTALGCQRGRHHTLTCSSAFENAWSPALSATTRACPVHWLIFNETDEADGTPVAQPDAMTSALQSVGCPVTEDIMPGTQHAWTYWLAVLPAIETAIG